MEKNDYRGHYKIGRRPERFKAHNARSWENIEEVLAKGGGVASFDALERAVADHESGSSSAPHPCQFVIYCIGNGWLSRK